MTNQKINKKTATPLSPVSPRLTGVEEGKNKRLDLHAFDDALLTWKAPEYLHHEKSMIWYICASIVLLFLVWYGIASESLTFSIAMIVFAGTYYLFQRHVPPTVDIVISRIGVKIGHHHFSYSRMKGFWVVHEPPFASKLYLRMSSKFHPDIFVELGDSDPSDIRHTLSKYVKEFKNHGEPFADTLVRLFRL